MTEMKCLVCGKTMPKHTYADGETSKTGLPPGTMFRNGYEGFRCEGNNHEAPYEYLILPDGSQWYWKGGWHMVISLKPRKGKLIGGRLFQM